jgi:hypothetical protein
LSEVIETRLFETGWSSEKAIGFVGEPIFIVEHPAPPCRKWAVISLPSDDWWNTIAAAALTLREPY